MPFRDPTTTLPADAIEGELDQDQIPDVLTGKTVQTGLGGRRIVMAPNGKIYFYSGAASETAPGEVWCDVFTYDDGDPLARLTLRSPRHTGGVNSSDLNLYLSDTGQQRYDLGPLLAYQDLETLEAGLIVTGDTVITRTAYVGGGLTGPYGTFSEEGDWGAVTFSAWKQSTNSVYQPIRMSRGQKRARFDGCAMVATAYGPGNQIAFTLPEGYRPTKEHYYAVPNVSSGTPGVVGCRINPAGQVIVYTGAALAVNALYDFSNVSWPLD